MVAFLWALSYKRYWIGRKGIGAFAGKAMIFCFPGHRKQVNGIK
jgi:hypothetical protein